MSAVLNCERCDKCTYNNYPVILKDDPERSHMMCPDCQDLYQNLIDTILYDEEGNGVVEYDIDIPPFEQRTPGQLNKGDIVIDFSDYPINNNTTMIYEIITNINKSYIVTRPCGRSGTILYNSPKNKYNKNRIEGWFILK